MVSFIFTWPYHHLPIRLVLCHLSWCQLIYRQSFVVIASCVRLWWHFVLVALMLRIGPTIELVMKSRLPNDGWPMSRRLKSQKCRNYVGHGINACCVAIRRSSVQSSCYLLNVYSIKNKVNSFHYHTKNEL